MAEGNPSLAIAIAALFLAVSMGGAVYYISTTMTNGNDSIDDNDEIEPEPEPEPEPPIECSEGEREVLDDNLSTVVGCEKIIAPHNATFEQQSITITRGNNVIINWTIEGDDATPTLQSCSESTAIFQIKQLMKSLTVIGNESELIVSILC